MTTTASLERNHSGEPTGNFVISSNKNSELRKASVQADDSVSTLTLSGCTRRLEAATNPMGSWTEASMTVDVEGARQIWGQLGRCLEEYDTANSDDDGS